MQAWGSFAVLSSWVKRMNQIPSISPSDSPCGCTQTLLPAQTYHTYCGEGLDFEPAQDARQLVGSDVSGPLNPHVLSGGGGTRVVKKSPRNTAGENNACFYRNAKLQVVADCSVAKGT